MSAKAKAAAGAMAAVLGGTAVAAELIVTTEGWENVAYPDVAHGAKLATACAGVTEGIVLGRTYSDDECIGRTAQAMIKTGFAVYKCLPAGLPTKTFGGYISMAYNVGPAKFCGSSVAKEARAGRFWTSCARMNEKPNGDPQWVFARVGGVYVKFPGLVKRRAMERNLCEAGLIEAGIRR